MFQVEEGEAQPQFSALWEFLEAGFVHTLNLFEQLSTIVRHGVLTFLLTFFGFEGTVGLIAHFLVSLNVADEQHQTVFVFLVVDDQFKH